MRGDAAHRCEVMIQDVNELNARIYFCGYMYVGGRGHCSSPDYFAPYFTKQCATSQVVPHVEEAGISWISRVRTVCAVPVRQLMEHPESAVDQGMRKHRYWKERWRQGLYDIADRARKEGFPEKNDPHRLYFLEGPEELGQRIKKGPNLYQLAWHTSRTLAFITSPGRTLL